jgi:hypothetical protein
VPDRVNMLIPRPPSVPRATDDACRAVWSLDDGHFDAEILERRPLPQSQFAPQRLTLKPGGSYLLASRARVRAPSISPKSRKAMS